MNQLQMELTDKNTVIYNLYKKIECLEQALMISKQRMNSQVKEIEVRNELLKSIRHWTVLQCAGTSSETGNHQRSPDQRTRKRRIFAIVNVSFQETDTDDDRWPIDR